MDMGDMGDMDMGDSNTTMTMNEWFSFSRSATVLFKGWSFSTTGGLIGAMIGIFIMAAVYEGLKYFREYLFRRTFQAVSAKGNVPEVHQVVQPTMLSKIHFCQTCLHMVQVILSYFLMLIFMTYNAWLCIAVVLGAGVGFFVFGWKKSTIVDITEHCN